MSVYVYHINLPQSKMWPAALIYIHFTLSASAMNKYACHIVYLCPTALVLQSTYRAHITAYIIKKKQTAIIIGHATPIYVPTTNRALKCHIFFIWTQYNQQWPQTLIEIYFTLLTYGPDKYACHISHASPTACLLYSAYRLKTTAQISKNTINCNFKLPS